MTDDVELVKGKVKHHNRLDVKQNRASVCVRGVEGEHDLGLAGPGKAAVNTHVQRNLGSSFKGNDLGKSVLQVQSQTKEEQQAGLECQVRNVGLVCT